MGFSFLGDYLKVLLRLITVIGMGFSTDVNVIVIELFSIDVHGKLGCGLGVHVEGDEGESQLVELIANIDD